MIRGIHLAILVLSIAPSMRPLRGQSLASHGTALAPLEVTLSYNADRTAGSTGVPIWLQGSGVDFSAPFTRHFSLAGEVDALHVNNINSANEGLGMVSYLFGPRFSCRRYRGSTPFAQVLIGGVHGFDAFFPNVPASAETPDAFAFSAGGGVSVGVSRHIAIRPVQVDYFQAHLPNDASNRENNLRMGAGLVLVINPPK